MPQRPTESGQHLGEFRLIDRIGSGAQGEVWLAEDSIGRRVAVKRLWGSSGSAKPNREEEALRLYQGVSNDANLLRVLHVGRCGSGLYYSMELADLVESTDGSPVPMTLMQLIESTGAIAADESARILTQVLNGVAAVHAKGLLHRDIKPSNILRVAGTWKLADIGLMTEDRTEVTALGTLEFMPPNGRIDRTADLYSCGKVLYCMMTGQSARSFPTLPKALLATDSARIRVLNAAVNRACEPNPARRFQSVAEFRSAIEDSGVRRFPLGRLLGIAAACMMLVAVGWGALRGGRKSEAVPAWEKIFNGEDIEGWGSPFAKQGSWSVDDRGIRCVRDSEYKLLGPKQSYGPGTLRVVASPDHDGARFGVRYACDQPGGGPLFMVMGDKFTWLRGNKELFDPQEPGNWFSFPGPVPRAGEDVTLEVEWGPGKHQLRANGRVLYDLPPTQFVGPMMLHVWAGDSATFRSVEFQPATEN